MLEASAPAIDRLRFQEAMAALPQAIRAMPQPVIAAVNGPCVGAGLALCLAADIRICSTAASFGNAAILLGLSGAEMGMSYHLPRIVGTSVAADWMLTGRMVSAQEADRRGLVSEVVDTEAPDDLLDAGPRIGFSHRRSRPARRAADQTRPAGQHRRAGTRPGHRTREPQPGAHPCDRRCRRTSREMVDLTMRRREQHMAWDFSTDPDWAEQLAWVNEFVRNECEPIDLIVKESHDLERPGSAGADPAAAADRQGARTVGHPPRTAPRWTRLRPGEAGAAQRDPRPIRVRTDRIRFARTGFRQQRDPGALRHPRAQGTLSRAAARQPDRLLLLDDRAAGRRRPEGVHHQRRSGRSNAAGSSTARSGSPRSRRWRRS